MDLSVQSSRNSNSPINVNLVPNMKQHNYGHKQILQQHVHNSQQQQAQMYPPNNYSINSLSPNSSVTADIIQPQQQLQQQEQLRYSAQPASISFPNIYSYSMQTIPTSPPPSPVKYFSSNGNVCEATLPSVTTTDSTCPHDSSESRNGRTDSATSPPSFINNPHTSNIKNDTNWSQMQGSYNNNKFTATTVQKPVQLNRKERYTLSMFDKLPSHPQQHTSAQRNSPVRISTHTQQQHLNLNSSSTGKHNSSHMPPTSYSPEKHHSSAKSEYSSTKTIEQHKHLQYQQAEQFSHLTTMDNCNKISAITENIDVHLDTTAISDLSTNAINALYKLPEVKYIQDNPESPTMLSSNDESLDSNSSSSGSHVYKKKITEKIVRLSINESKELTTIRQEDSEVISGISSRCSNFRNPKILPQRHRNSHKKLEILSTSETGVPIEIQSFNTSCSNESPHLKNGCKRPVINAESSRTVDEIKTINHIDDEKTSYKEMTSNTYKHISDISKMEKQQLVHKRSTSHLTFSTNPSYQKNISLNELICEDKDTDIGQKAICDYPIADRPDEHQETVLPPSSNSNSNSSNNTFSSSNYSKVSQSNTSIKSQETHSTAENVVLSHLSKSVLQKGNADENALKCVPIKGDVVNVTIGKTEHKPTPFRHQLNSNNKQHTDINKHRITEKCCFEEVENKLEEMFAGIEDEPVANRKIEEIDGKNTHVPYEDMNNMSLALELANNSNCNIFDEENKIEAVESPTDAYNNKKISQPVKANQSPQTKAAKKAIEASPVIKPYSLPTVVISRTTEETSPKELPPHRRLSIGMDPSFLHVIIDVESNKQNAEKENHGVKKETNNKFSVRIDKEVPSTSAAAAMQAFVVTGTSTYLKKKKTMMRKVEQRSHCKRGSSSSSTKFKQAISIDKDKLKVDKIYSKRKRILRSKQGRWRNPSLSSNDEHEGKIPNVREADSKYKSPFILVKQDGSVNVINTPSAEDVNETKLKKTLAYTCDRTNIRGLHSSTLSNKYDANTTDSTWVCVFCKRGPHKMGLGDLFGPYLVSSNCEEYQIALYSSGKLNMNSFSENKRRRIDMVQHNPRNLPVVPAAQHTAIDTIGNRLGMNKKKRQTAEELTMTNRLLAIDSVDYNADTTQHDAFIGMCKISENNYEIWLHEDCTVWAPDVFLVGARIMGIDKAVWNSTRYQCVLCTKPGAIICCLHRECKATAHVPCAREAYWSLDESTHKVHCQAHSTKPYFSHSESTLPLLSGIRNF